VSLHHYEVVRWTSAPRSVVFEVLADGSRWAEWAPMIGRSSYERPGHPSLHGVGAVRCFGAGVGPVSKEEVVRYEEPVALSYETRSSGLPMQGYRADVTLTGTPGGTRITWRGEWTSTLPGLTWALRRMVSGFADGLVEESERQALAAP
jgi:hypothetical protein